MAALFALISVNSIQFQEGKIMFRFKLRTKMLLSVGTLIVIVLGTSTIFHIRSLKRNYLEALQWRSEALAQILVPKMIELYGYEAEMQRTLGLAVECDKLYEAHKAKSVIRVGVINEANMIAAHSDAELWDTPIESSALLPPLQNRELTMVLDGSAYQTLVPVFDDQETYVGTIAIGTSKDAVDAKVRQLIYQALGLLALFGGLAFIVTSGLVYVVVTKPIRRLVATSQRIARGEIIHASQAERREQQSPRPDQKKSFDEIEALTAAFQDVVRYFQEMALTANQIASGDLSHAVACRSEHDELGNAFRSMATHLQNVLRELDDLIQAVQAGDLSRRGNTESFSGDWRDLVEGLNSVIDLCVKPINVAAAHLEQMSKGVLPAHIAEEYQGDFNGIKMSVNALIEVTQNVTQLAETMAAGDLSIEISERSAEDALMQALNVMLGKLNSIVREVKTSAEYVATGSQTISAVSAQMSQGATEQASAAEEASAAMEEMVANIRQNTENAKMTENIALESAKDAQEGGLAVSQTVEAMKGIAGKISIIQEIAMQTNILSMNATIEAAKAREYGKGFAVVASEVRDLAQRSRTAAEDIELLVTSCVTVSEQAGEILQRLVPNSEKTAELVQEINSASSEQYTGAQHINTAIQQLDQVIQQNAATSEQMTASAEELASQAAQFQDVVAFFTVKEVSPEREDQEDEVVQALRTLINAKGTDEQMLVALLKSVLGNKPERTNAQTSSDDQEPQQTPSPADDAKSDGHNIALETAEEKTDELDAEFERY